MKREVLEKWNRYLDEPHISDKIHLFFEKRNEKEYLEQCLREAPDDGIKERLGILLSEMQDLYRIIENEVSRLELEGERTEIDFETEISAPSENALKSKKEKFNKFFAYSKSFGSKIGSAFKRISWKNNFYLVKQNWKPFGITFCLGLFISFLTSSSGNKVDQLSKKLKTEQKKSIGYQSKLKNQESEVNRLRHEVMSYKNQNAHLVSQINTLKSKVKKSKKSKKKRIATKKARKKSKKRKKKYSNSPKKGRRIPSSKGKSS